MDPELYLAYDGSINADWVARYAIRMGSNTPGRSLTLLHIIDGSVAEETVVPKIDLLVQHGQKLQVELKPLYLPLEKDVVATLVKAIPWGKDSYCICGARSTSRGKGFLSGTISLELLRLRRFNTLALRVVNPGLLGCPANVMFSLSGHPQKFTAASPFVLMLSPCIKKLVLMRVMTFAPLLFRYLPVKRAQKALQQGMAYMRDVIEEVNMLPGEKAFRIDDHVLISDDWVKEVLVQASKVHAGLILLGASDKFLQSRFYYGNRIEQILRSTPCDVGVYRKI